MELDPKHNEAIRKEVGDRLQGLLPREPFPLPLHLGDLVRRLNEADAPSLAADSVHLGAASNVESRAGWLDKWRAFKRWLR